VGINGGKSPERGFHRGSQKKESFYSPKEKKREVFNEGNKEGEPSPMLPSGKKRDRPYSLWGKLIKG